MSCGSFRLWCVSDDLEDRRRAHKHATECPRCREILEGQQALCERVGEWAESFSPPEDLEEGVRRRIEALDRPAVEPTRRATTSGTSPHRSRLWLALAASLLVGVGLGVLELPAEIEAPAETRRLLDASDLKIAKEQEQARLREISELEGEASSILAGTSARDLEPRQAAILMEYRSRLSTLDVTIDDVRAFVAQNPGHPRARTMLLDAYKEKMHLLREVIVLEEESS